MLRKWTGIAAADPAAAGTFRGRFVLRHTQFLHRLGQ